MRFLGLAMAVWLGAGVAQAQSPSEAEAAWQAARAVSPLSVTLIRQHATWQADRQRDPTYAADADQGWTQEWTRAAERDRGISALRPSLGDVSDGCIDMGLTGCTATLGGWLNAPGGRLYWQIQDGADDYDGITAGVVFLAPQADGRLRPVGWTLGGVHFDPPVLIQSGETLYVAAAGITGGTGAFNADVVFRWTPGAEHPLVQVDNEAWRDETLPAMLPPGLEVWKGVAFDYAGLTARTPLWRPDDANCCATGGEAMLGFELEGDVLKLVSVSPDDAVLDFVMTTPADVVDWMGRSLLCEHWGGEEGYDADRRAQIAEAVTQLKCDALQTDQTALEAKYVDNPGALAGIARITARGD